MGGCSSLGGEDKTRPFDGSVLMNIDEYYRSLNISIERMVFIGVHRRNLSEVSIRKAAREVFEEIELGTLIIPDIRVAWEVFARAKHLKVKDESEISALKAKIDALQSELSKSWIDRNMPILAQLIRRTRT